jgi:hypothetical protein
VGSGRGAAGLPLGDPGQPARVLRQRGLDLAAQDGRCEVWLRVIQGLNLH